MWCYYYSHISCYVLWRPKTFQYGSIRAFHVMGIRLDDDDKPLQNRSDLATGGAAYDQLGFARVNV